MPVTYRIDAEAALLFVTGRGVVTQVERLEAMRGFLSDPAFRSDIDTFFDLSEVSTTPTLADLREIVVVVKEHAAAIGHSRVALLASKPITFGIGRVLEAIAEVEAAPLEVKVFFDRTRAWEWLRPGYVRI